MKRIKEKLAMMRIVLQPNNNLEAGKTAGHLSRIIAISNFE